MAEDKKPSKAEGRYGDKKKVKEPEKKPETKAAPEPDDGDGGSADSTAMDAHGAMVKRHLKEARDLHGQHRDAMKDMHARHESEMKDMMAQMQQQQGAQPGGEPPAAAAPAPDAEPAAA